MKKQTTLWLLLALAVLGALAWWQLGREEDDLGAIDLPLYEDLVPARVKAFDVDHVERGYQLRLERDARGAWYITDPIVYPADLGVVKLLLDFVATARALRVPKVERDARALGLDPPRAVFTVEEETDSGVVRHALELGALDLDGRRVNVRKDGRYLRTLRTIDTTLKRSVFDYRSRQAMQIDGNAVVELNRTGQYQPTIDDAPVDLRLNAVRDGPVWRALVPYQVTLDPLDVALVSHAASGLSIDAFVDDAPTSLAEYGLDPPEFRVELRTLDGVREALRFGRTGFGRTWHACREGEPYVWSIAVEDVQRLVLSFDDLIDRHLLRVPRDQIEALRLECDGRVLRAERSGEEWTVSETRPGESAPAAVHPAEASRVLDVLSRLEAAEIDDFRLGAAFPPEAASRAVYVEAAGRTLGGRIGAPVEASDGGARKPGKVLFQRLGDEVPAVADAWLAELACMPLDALRSLALVRVDEFDLVGLELAHAGETRRYERSELGRWTRAGSGEEARELVPVLDPLFFLRAKQHLGAGGEALADPIEVVLNQRGGKALRFVIGLAPGPDGARSAAEVGGARSLLQVADLHAKLAALFAG